MKKQSFEKSVTAVVTAFCMLASSVSYAAPVAKVEVPIFSSALLSQASEFSIPAAIGNIESWHPGKDKTIFHIQTAHGHYQAQKNIQAMLEHLQKKYGVKTVLLEGAWDNLDQSILNFIPEDKKLNHDILDALTHWAIVKGPELYLADHADARGYGIEERDLYLQNGRDFSSVIRATQGSEDFLNELDQSIERTQVKFLPSDARSFLKRIERYTAGDLSLDVYLRELQALALKTLKIDLTGPEWQYLFPGLVRYLTLQKIEKQLDVAKFEGEKQAFLAAIKPYVAGGRNPEARGPVGTDPHAGSGTGSVPFVSIYSEVKNLLNLKDLSTQLPDGETRRFFEEMTTALPANFNYKAYPAVCALIGMLILKSEILPESFMSEIEKLQDIVLKRMAPAQDAESVFALIKDFRMLKKLFALQLLPNDFDRITTNDSTLPAGRQGPTTNDKRIQPSALVARLQSLNAQRPASSVQTSRQSVAFSLQSVKRLDALYARAIRFYEGAKKRDEAMLQGIENRLKETGADKVAVVTGGFHSAPFKKYFESKGYSYGLLTPKITDLDKVGYSHYIEAALTFAGDSQKKSASANQLQKSTWETGSSLSPAWMAEPGVATGIVTSTLLLNALNPFPDEARERVISQIQNFRRSAADTLKSAASPRTNVTRSEMRFLPPQHVWNPIFIGETGAEAISNSRSVWEILKRRGVYSPAFITISNSFGPTVNGRKDKPKLVNFYVPRDLSSFAASVGKKDVPDSVTVEDVADLLDLFFFINILAIPTGNWPDFLKDQTLLTLAIKHGDNRGETLDVLPAFYFYDQAFYGNNRPIREVMEKLVTDSTEGAHPSWWGLLDIRDGSGDKSFTEEYARGNASLMRIIKQVLLLFSDSGDFDQAFAFANAVAEGEMGIEGDDGLKKSLSLNERELRARFSTHKMIVWDHDPTSLPNGSHLGKFLSDSLILRMLRIAEKKTPENYEELKRFIRSVAFLRAELEHRVHQLKFHFNTVSVFTPNMINFFPEPIRTKIMQNMAGTPPAVPSPERSEARLAPPDSAAVPIAAGTNELQQQQQQVARPARSEVRALADYITKAGLSPSVIRRILALAPEEQEREFKIILDKANAVSGNGAEFLAGDEPTPAVIPQKASLQERIAYLKSVAAGEIAFVDFAAGAATRLNVGTEYDKIGLIGLSKAILKKFPREAAQKPEASEFLQLIERAAAGKIESSEDLTFLQLHLIGLSAQMARLVEETPEAGVSLAQVLAGVRFVAVASDDNDAAFQAQISTLRGAGLGKVYQMTQNKGGVQKINLNGTTEYTHELRVPEGHFVPLRDMIKRTGGSFVLDSHGEFKPVETTLQAELSQRGVKRLVFAQGNDLFLLSDFAAVERVATAEREMTTRGVRMVQEMVGNTIQQKGGGVKAKYYFLSSQITNSFGVKIFKFFKEIQDAINRALKINLNFLKVYSWMRDTIGIGQGIIPRSLSRMFYVLDIAALDLLRDHEDQVPLYGNLKKLPSGEWAVSPEQISGDTSSVIPTWTMEKVGHELVTYKLRPRTGEALAAVDASLDDVYVQRVLREFAPRAARSEFRNQSVSGSVENIVAKTGAVGSEVSLRSEFRVMKYFTALIASASLFASGVGVAQAAESLQEKTGVRVVLSLDAAIKIPVSSDEILTAIDGNKNLSVAIAGISSKLGLPTKTPGVNPTVVINLNGIDVVEAINLMKAFDAKTRVIVVGSAEDFPRGDFTGKNFHFEGSLAAAMSKFQLQAQQPVGLVGLARFLNERKGNLEGRYASLAQIVAGVADVVMIDVNRSQLLRFTNKLITLFEVLTTIWQSLLAQKTVQLSA